jgi:hypothetical protein
MANIIERATLNLEITNSGTRIHVSCIDETTKQVTIVRDLAPTLQGATLSAIKVDVNSALTAAGLPTIP